MFEHVLPLLDYYTFLTDVNNSVYVIGLHCHLYTAVLATWPMPVSSHVPHLLAYLPH